MRNSAPTPHLSRKDFTPNVLHQKKLGKTQIGKKCAKIARTALATLLIDLKGKLEMNKPELIVTIKGKCYWEEINDTIKKIIAEYGNENYTLRINVETVPCYVDTSGIKKDVCEISIVDDNYRLRCFNHSQQSFEKRP